MAAQLLAAGVPVWLVRTDSEIATNIIIQDIVAVCEPTDIVTHHYMDPVGQFAWPFPVIVRCSAGSEEMHAKIRGATYVAKDLGSDAGDSGCPEVLKGVHRNSRRKAEGWQVYPKSKPVVPPMQRDPWEMVESILLPPIVPCFRDLPPGMKIRLDRGQFKSRMNLASTLRFPDPGMIVAVQSPDTMRRYVGNWLAIRSAWIQHVVDDPLGSLPTSKMWRTFLLSTPADLASVKTTESSRERKRALEFFKDFIPKDATGFSWASDEFVGFRKETVKVFERIPTVQLRRITWELHELHFQFDVLAMDHALVPTMWRDAPADRQALWREVFPSDSIGGTWDGPLPMHDAGVFRNSKEDKFRLLNAFAWLLSDWPDAPSLFKEPITPSHGDRVVCGAMVELMKFYVKTFYVHNGRPPICPRCVPVS